MDAHHTFTMAGLEKNPKNYVKKPPLLRPWALLEVVEGALQQLQYLAAQPQPGSVVRASAEQQAR
jgi:hypothetical protein